MQKKNYILIFLCLISVSVIIDIGRINSFEFTSNSDMNINPEAARTYQMNIGAWIIVAGGVPINDVYQCYEKGTISVYNVIRTLGWSADDIYFLATDYDGSLPSQANDVSTRDNIEYAITTWAADKVSDTKALGIYLFGSGNSNFISLPGGKMLDTVLNSYLDTLESATGMYRSLIVYEGPRSGSFINPLSKDNRIVITSTDRYLNTYVNPQLTHGIFSSHFWINILQGKTLGYSFVRGTQGLTTWGLQHLQIPLIDDNHDEIGNSVQPWWALPKGGDGLDALQITLGVPPPVRQTLNILKVFLPKFAPKVADSSTFWAVIDNNTNLEYFKATIMPSEWPVPAEDKDGIIYHTGDDFPVDSFFDITFTIGDEDGELGEDGVWGYNYSASLTAIQHRTLFSTDGDYRIVIEAKAENGATAQPVASTISINDDGVKPVDRTPPTVEITNPFTDLNITESMSITVEADDNQGLDKVQILLDGDLLEEVDMPDYYPYPEVKYSFDIDDYPEGNTERNLTAKATDKAGNIQQTSVNINIYKNDTSDASDEPTDDPSDEPTDDPSDFEIPGFDIPMIFVSSFLCIIVILVKYKKSASNIVGK